MMNSTLQLGALLTTLWAGTAVSCSGSPPELSPEPSSAATPARVLSQHGSATPRPPGAVPSVPASPPASTPAPVAPATYQATTITRVLAEPVHALGVDGQYGALGALGGDAWMTTRFKEGQERTWRKLPFPKHLRPAADEKDEARIYFGRDNQPRVMGTRFGPDGPRQHYLRFRHGRWKTEPHELAAFAGRPHAALYGWLGWDDPEVLCKVGRFCLLKSRRGWSQAPLVVPSPGVALRVDYGADGPFALTDTPAQDRESSRASSGTARSSWARQASACGRKPEQTPCESSSGQPSQRSTTCRARRQA